MSKEDILHKFNYLLDETISKQDKESMEISRTMFKKAVCIISNYDVNKAEEFVECFEGNLKYNNYLSKHEASKTVTDQIVKELIKQGYLNDKVMSSHILDSMVNKLKGPKKYEEKLFSKGIKDYVIYDSYLEDEVLDKVIKKNKDLYQKYPKKKQIEKLANKLISDGFSSSKVFSKVTKLEYNDNSSVTIDKYIEKLKKKYDKLTGFELKRKIVSSLLQKGYDYSLISKKLDINLDD